MPFEFEKQKIEDVILVKPKVFGDNRGFFMETYKKSDFFANGITEEFVPPMEVYLQWLSDRSTMLHYKR